MIMPRVRVLGAEKFYLVLCHLVQGLSLLVAERPIGRENLGQGPRVAPGVALDIGIGRLREVAPLNARGGVRLQGQRGIRAQLIGITGVRVI